MSKTKRGKEWQIASKIKAGSDFTVKTEKERKMALTAAKFLGADIATRAIAGGFMVYVASEVTN